MENVLQPLCFAGWDKPPKLLEADGPWNADAGYTDASASASDRRF